MPLPRTNASSSLPTGVLTHQPLMPPKANPIFFQRHKWGIEAIYLLNFSKNLNAKRRNDNWDASELSRAAVGAKPDGTAEHLSPVDRSSGGCHRHCSLCDSLRGCLAGHKKYPSCWDKKNIARFITFTEVSSSLLPKPGPWDLLPVPSTIKKSPRM